MILRMNYHKFIFNHFTSILILFLSILLPGNASAAQPGIFTIDGTLIDGQIVTITSSGLNFGTKLTAAPILVDLIDNQPRYDSLTDGSPVPTDSNSVWSTNTNTQYSLSRPNRGARQAHYYGVGGKVIIGWPYALANSSQNSLYVSWYYKTDTDPGSEGGSNKFIRIWDDPNGTGTRISWTQMHLTYNISDTTFSESWGDWGGVLNTWNRLELWVDANAGVIKAWTNGALTHNITNFVKTNNGLGLNIDLVGFDNSTGAYASMNSDIGEIYIDNTLARVEISNSSTWSGSTSSEIQIPTSWNSDSIQIEVNQGGLSTLDGAYLYVMDSNGNVNSNGYKLNITAPKRPADVVELP